MKSVLLAAVAALGLAGAARAEPLVTVLTSAEPQTQLMAMVLTLEAVKQGAAAHVLLCGPAGDIALKDAPASATAPQKPQGASPKGVLQAAMQAGATAAVCAIYLPNKGLQADALSDGVAVAAPQKMAEQMLAGRVWTF